MRWRGRLAINGPDNESGNPQAEGYGKKGGTPSHPQLMEVKRQGSSKQFKILIDGEDRQIVPGGDGANEEIGIRDQMQVSTRTFTETAAVFCNRNRCRTLFY